MCVIWSRRIELLYLRYSLFTFVYENRTPFCFCITHVYFTRLMYYGVHTVNFIYVRTFLTHSKSHLTASFISSFYCYEIVTPISRLEICDPSEERLSKL